MNNYSAFDRSSAVVEDALRSMPLTPVPRTLRARVMRRVRSSAAPHFVFPWLEGALSLMLSALLTVLAYLLISVDPVTVIRLEQNVRLFLLFPANRAALAAAVPMLGMLGLFLLLTVRLVRPRHRAARRIAAAR
jgi:hypothetical protein